MAKPIGGRTNPTPNGAATQARDYPSGSLWLEIASPGANSPGTAVVTLHGTVPGTNYALLCRSSILGTAQSWSVEREFVGATNQDWTPAAVSLGGAGCLFLWARSLVDSDGDGLPDWWELAHGLDPNDPDTGERRGEGRR